MKLPLAIPIDSRNGNGQYDARPVNVLKESSAANESIVKRPALVKVTGPDTPANGNGLVDFDGTLISVFGAQPAYARRTYQEAEHHLVPVANPNKSLYNVFGVSGSNIICVQADVESPCLVSDDGGSSWVGLESPYSLTVSPEKPIEADVGFSSVGRSNGMWCFAFLMENPTTYDIRLVSCRLQSGAWLETGTIMSVSGPDRSSIKYCMNDVGGGVLYSQIKVYNTSGVVYYVFRSDDSGDSWSEVASLTNP